MITKNQFIFLFLLCTILFSCAYNKNELPEPIILPDNGLTVTYTSHGKNIFDTYCISCHSPFGSESWLNLSTFQGVKVPANSGKIQARVIDENPSVMPPTGSLPQVVKDTLQMWLNQGALE
jgi:mono/diheme cytochrome c family protein